MITLRVLKLVLCFHMTRFNYGSKKVRDVDPACRFYQSNIMPDSIFSVDIGVIFWASFIRRDRALSFITITLTGLGKT